ncbi:MAG: tail fiber domain-containing protein [Rhizobacter sp.]|nr:tail fiber domain-containing protein [Ferruginibacter sp.]
MKAIFSVFFFFAGFHTLSAQNSVGIGTSTPNANAVLEIKSNNKGLLMPRLANAARNNMTGVSKGMIVFDSTYNSFYYHDGSRWLPIADNNADSLLTDHGATPQVTVNMTSSASTLARSGILYDNGGPGGNYGNNRRDNYAIEKDFTDDSTIAYKVIIEVLTLESPYDTLEIYSSGQYASKQVFTGSRTGTFYFLNNGDPLYFTFSSNAVNNAAGFKIRWSKLTTSIAATDVPPIYGWYFNQRKIAMRGGVNTFDNWSTDSLGTRSFAYGVNNKASGEGAVAFGSGNTASGNNSFIAGSNNRAESFSSIAMGSGSVAKGGRGNNVAIGFNAVALNDNAIALGATAKAEMNDALAIGTNSRAKEAGAIAIGPSSFADGNSSLALGSSVTATADFSTAIGSVSRATGLGATSIGSGTKAIGNFSFAAGDQAEARAISSVAIGIKAIASGNFAAAVGNNTLASGVSATALGQNTTASGTASFASGSYTNASGIAATSLGGGSLASGTLALAAGENNVASGPNSLAMGAYNYSTGSGSVAIGAVNTSGGNRSVVLGTTLMVQGDYATAIGTKITIPPTALGSLGIGDLEFSNNVVDNTSLGNANEFVARFRGGYFFMSSGNAPGGNYSARTGVKIGPGQNSWSAISDVRVKENFEPVDGEEILRKIAGMLSVTWNYKAQDPKLFRHYGPMAQDFFEAFGKDKYGTIGCDTLINQQDFLGVSFVAIQALEKRSAAYLKEIEIMKEQLNALKSSNELLMNKLELINKENNK